MRSTPFESKKIDEHTHISTHKWDKLQTLENNIHFSYIPALRKHPPAANLARVATKDYKVPNSHYTMPKGMFVITPTYAIHHDPEFYENPEEFDPNRFTPERVKSRPSCTFLPFGDGPRNCIGLRFGMVQARIGLVKLLHNFEFSICARTQIPVKYSPKKLVLSPENGIWLKVTQLD